MCGIVGFNWEEEKKIKFLASLLEHRGPEQEGFHVGDGVSIGHKRLRILDLSEKARQPIYNEDNTVCLSYNGEIYNFQDLRDKLEKASHKFVSKTDSEVLVHAYEEWGVSLLNKINGQFAFCIFDKKKNIFFIARDRLGIKPLYYYQSGKKFVFGSELKVFLESDIKKQINQVALDHYMLFGNTPSKQSILENVEKLLPGSYIIYDLASSEIKEYRQYWALSFSEDSSLSETEAIDQIRKELDRSVKMRLISDVPLGAFLSGGVDSSIIVAIMRKYVKNLKTFSIKFDHPDFNESMYAKIISEKFGTEHFEIAFDAQDVKKLIPKLVCYYDEPFGDSSMIPTYLVSSVAKKHVTVSLSGTGGDELFGGYNRYNDFVVLQRINHMPEFVKRILDYSIDKVNPLLRKDKLSKLQMFLGKKEPLHFIYLKLFSYMFRSKREHIDKLLQFDYMENYFKYSKLLTNAMNFDLNEYLPNCLLVKEDRASMAVSLEARVPFLDHELVKLASRIPPNLKIKNREKKYILKKAFADTLPHTILHRKKQGFGVPLVHYFRNELKDFVYNEIFGFQEYNYYDKIYLNTLWERHQKKLSDYSRIFWSIIMFNLWYKKWMT